MAYEMIDGKKVWVSDPNATKVAKKAYVEKPYPLSEIYSKDDKGARKEAELRGTRAQVVHLRREVRAKLNIGGERIILYVNGQLHKVGIDKGA
jgi:hypothetical protein